MKDTSKMNKLTFVLLAMVAICTTEATRPWEDDHVAPNPWKPERDNVHAPWAKDNDNGFYPSPDDDYPLSLEPETAQDAAPDTSGCYCQCHRYTYSYQDKRTGKINIRGNCKS